jgi:hypothetical protein
MDATGGIYRAGLRTTLRSSAAAYGYALTIATTAAELTTVHGKPGSGELFLFVAGGLAAFAVLETVLLTVRSPDGDAASHAFPFAGALNFIAVGAALGAAIGLTHAVGSAVAWLLSPLVATAVYLLLVAGQVTVIHALRS